MLDRVAFVDIWLLSTALVLTFGGVKAFSSIRIPPQQPRTAQRRGREPEFHQLTASLQEEQQTSSSGSSSANGVTDTSDRLPDFAYQPLPLHTYAGKIEQALKDEFGNDHGQIERVLQCWRMLDAGYEYRASVQHLFNEKNDDDQKKEGSFREQHCHSYVPGLTIREFWDTQHHDNQLEWANNLESHFEAIYQELQSVLSAENAQSVQERGNNVWAGALTDDASSYGVGWKTLVLQDRGVWDPTNVALFPVTAKAVHDDCRVPSVEVFFASMQPHSVIQPHSDFTNFVLTSHLALIIPGERGQCRLRIGDTVRPWIPGQVSVFDTSLRHDAINETDETRYILMMRVWHPDLSNVERQALQRIWDCLEDASLTSHVPAERRAAQERAEQRRQFPEQEQMPPRSFGIARTSLLKDGNSKQKKPQRGFGGGGGGGSNNKKKKRKKGNKK